MFRSTLAVVLLTVLGAAPLHAQRSNMRQGFWFGFGLGVGSFRHECSCCCDKHLGPSGFVKLGGTLSPHVLLGGEIGGWRHSFPKVYPYTHGERETVKFAAFLLTLYPSARGAFFVKVGLGGMTFSYYPGDTYEAPAASLGLGFDIRVVHSFSLTPFLNAFRSLPAKGKGAITYPVPPETFVGAQLGLGLTWL